MKEREFAFSSTLNGRNVLLTLSIAAVIAALFYCDVIYTSSLDLWDLRVFYDAAQRIGTDQPVFGAHYGPNGNSYYYYPPLLIQVLRPFTEFSFSTLKLLWCLISFLAILWSSVLITDFSKEFAPSVSARSRLLLTLLMVACWPPLISGLQWGQVHVLILLLLAGSMHSMQQSKDLRAGVLLGLAAMLKMSPALLILAPIRFGRRRAVWGFILSLIILEGISFILPHGLELNRQFFAGIPGMFFGNLEPGLEMNYVAEKVLLDPFGFAGSMNAAIVLKIGLCAVFAYLLMSLRLNSPAALLRGFGMGVAFMLLLSPTLWYQHLTWLLIPFAVLVSREYDSGLRTVPSYIAIIVLYLLVALQPLIHALAIMSGGGLSAARLSPVLAAFALVLLLRFGWKKEEDRNLYILLGGVAVFLGIIVRLAGIFNDFSLDEIWSYNIAHQASSLWDAVFGSRDENAHPLNMVFMYFLGDQYRWWLYRLPSFFAGIGSLALVIAISRKMRAFEAFALIAFFSLSYPMILYGSEARGYSSMLFFILLSWIFLRKYLLGETYVCAAAFGASCILALFSHFESVQYIFAAALWSSVLLFRRKPGMPAIRSILLLHGAPLLVAALSYILYIRFLKAGTGNIYALSDLIVNTFCLSYSAPVLSGVSLPMGLVPMIIALVLFLVFLGGIALVRSSGDSRWSFYILMIYAAPLTIILISGRVAIEARYFLPSIMFSYFLAASLLQYWAERDRFGRIIAACFLCCFIAGSFIYIRDFLSYGRGQYLDALRYIVTASDASSPIVLGSDFDFRNRTVIDFYKKYLPEGVRLSYVSTKTESQAVPAWFLKHSQAWNFKPSATLSLSNGHIYRLVKTFPYTQESGWIWFLYKKEDLPEG